MEIIEEIKNKVSMKDVLEHYGIYPVRGNNIYKCFVHDDHSPSANIIKNNNKFHCFRGDTEIITKNGIVKIGEYAGKFVEILNGNGDWEKVKIKSYGNQQLYKITLYCGGNQYGKIYKEIFATSGHRWFTNQHFGYKTVEKITTELKENDRLVCLSTKCNDIKFDKNAIRHGFIFGDGFKNINGNGKIARAFFYTKPKEKLIKYFDNVTYGLHPTGKIFLQTKYISDRLLTELPTINDSDEYILGFLAGYFAADGNFGKGICGISCCNREILEKVRDLCIHEKIMCKKITSRYRLGINNKYSWIYKFNVIASSLPNGFDLTERFIKKDTNMNYMHWKVKSVEEMNINEEVYCCETSTHSFVLSDNILTGNCFACGYSGDIFDVVEHFEKCDKKKAIQFINDIFHLGIIKNDNIDPKELRQMQKQREKERKQKEYWNKIEIDARKKMEYATHYWRLINAKFHPTKRQIEKDEWTFMEEHIFYESLKKIKLIDFLMDVICERAIQDEELYYIYGNNKQNIMKKIVKGEIKV